MTKPKSRKKQDPPRGLLGNQVPRYELSRKCPSSDQMYLYMARSFPDTPKLFKHELDAFNAHIFGGRDGCAICKATIALGLGC